LGLVPRMEFGLTPDPNTYPTLPYPLPYAYPEPVAGSYPYP
jgi:hypothetical protein